MVHTISTGKNSLPHRKTAATLERRIFFLLNTTCRPHIPINLLQLRLTELEITNLAGVYRQGIFVVECFVKIFNGRYLSGKRNWCTPRLSVRQSLLFRKFLLQVPQNAGNVFYLFIYIPKTFHVLQNAAKVFYLFVYSAILSFPLQRADCRLRTDFMR